MTTPPQIHTKIEKKTLETSAHMTLGLWVRVKHAWFRWAELNQHSHWFPFFIGAIVCADAIIVVLPGDIVVALAVLSNPKAWRQTWVASSIGSALGAFILYLFVAHTGGKYLDELQAVNEAMGAAAKWENAREFVKQWGVWSLTLGSVIPFFSIPPVILAGLAKSPALAVLGCLVLGRFLRFLIITYGVLYGWAFFQTIRLQAKEEREKALGHAHDPGPDR